MLRPGFISGYGGIVTAVTAFLQLETADHMLLESGDALILEG